MDKETYEVALARYKEAEPGSAKADKALKEMIEILAIQQAYDQTYVEAPTGIQGLLKNSDLVGFSRDVVVTVLVLKFEQLNVFTSRVGSFVRLNRK